MTKGPHYSGGHSELYEYDDIGDRDRYHAGEGAPLYGEEAQAGQRALAIQLLDRRQKSPN